MGKAIIREGDTTSHGGTVLEAFPTLTVYGKNAAGVGHQVSCPKCKGSFPIVQGASNYTFMGKNVAVESMQTACGAVLIASQGQATVDNTPGGTISMGAGAVAAALAGAAAVSKLFDEQIRFFTADRNVLANTPYKLTLADGSTVEGRTDHGGKTQRIETDGEQEVTCAEFFPETFYGCACTADHMCAAGGRAPAPALRVELQGIKTNSQAVGASVVNHTLPPADVRPMTAGEIAMARSVFKDSLDYGRVKIHRGGLLGQPDRSGNATGQSHLYVIKATFPATQPTRHHPNRHACAAPACFSWPDTASCAAG